MSVHIVSVVFVLAGVAGVTAGPLAGGTRAHDPRRVEYASSASDPARSDVPADEMLRRATGRWERWTTVPELVVLTSVMEYHAREAVAYHATAETLRDEDVEELVHELTIALRELTGRTITQFAAVHRDRVAPGDMVPLMQPGRIVAGRYRGVRDVAHTLGFGGRQARRDGTITAGAIVLDEHFDRTSEARQLSRMHELGHALGFNHVTSRVSVMNTHIGAPLTDVDRTLARLAFSRALGHE